MKYDKSVLRALSLITQFSINMLVPILMCTFLGMFIDRKAGTSFWVVILFFVGAMAGFRNIYIFAKKIFDNKSGDNRQPRSVFFSLGTIDILGRRIPCAEMSLCIVRCVVASLASAH